MRRYSQDSLPGRRPARQTRTDPWIPLPVMVELRHSRVVRPSVMPEPEEQSAVAYILHSSILMGLTLLVCMVAGFHP